MGASPALANDGALRRAERATETVAVPVGTRASRPQMPRE
jgi:hypothetical protein